MTLALVIVAMPAHSVLINDLYVAEVTTVSQSDAQRRRDAGTGLRDVLVRVSGRLDVVEHPWLLRRCDRQRITTPNLAIKRLKMMGVMPDCLPPPHRRPRFAENAD